MNPFDLSASELLIWGLVLHLIADWPLQNDWMALNKMKRTLRRPSMALPYEDRTFTSWWVRHPAAYVHAGIHGLFLALVFGWVAAPLALAHMIIDCRWPVAKWSQFMKQTQPVGGKVTTHEEGVGWDDHAYFGIGHEVRIWNDQVFHIACIAIAAVLVTL